MRPSSSKCFLKSLIDSVIIFVLGSNIFSIFIIIHKTEADLNKSRLVFLSDSIIIQVRGRK